MKKRLWLSVAMLVVGGALLASAQLAGATSERKGGIFRVGTTGASVQIDPQLSYITTGWWLEYATAAKLYNYRPNGTLVPEVASRFTVSSNGARYTFFLRKGFRFSDGTPVTARNFKYAFDRLRNPELASPGKELAVNIGGVHAHGMKLVIHPKSGDGNLISTLTMPFFQATSTKLPLDREVVDVRSMNDLPSAGPYVFTLNKVNETTSLRRNPYWRRGPGRTQPRNLAGVDIRWNLNEVTAFNQVKNNELDEGPIPANEVQAVATQYGVNRSQFWVEPTNCLFSIAFNNSSGIFHANAPLRRAVNFALDRTDFVADAPYVSTPWTHLLPPGFPGSITQKRRQPYGVRSDIERARQLAAGHYRDGRVVLAYRTSSRFPARAQLVRRDLERLGLNVVMVPFGSTDEPSPGWDMLIRFGWCYDSPDPSRVLVSSLGSVPNSGKYLQRIRAADGLPGNKRLSALGKIDLEVMRNVAPVAVMHTYNNRWFFSSRVDPRSLKYHVVYEDWSIPALALK